MSRPCLWIDLDKIEHNARSICDLCAERGIEVSGVTKGVCGDPEVARAMLRGGVTSIGESRLENVARLRAAGVPGPFMLLRVPALSRVGQVALGVDLSLNSELVVLAALSDAAARAGRRHPVIAMVDLGDLREGVWPDELPGFVRAAAKLPGIRIAGLGANLSCYAGVAPSPRNMTQLVELAAQVEGELGAPLAWISGGNSSALPMIAAGELPGRINHVRIGEAILLGRETLSRTPWPGTFQDAFVLEAEVIECKRKPSAPLGERAQDAFGRIRRIEDRGEMLRALVDLGREDVEVAGLSPEDARLRVLGASSDYLILDATGTGVRVGDRLRFSLGYGALLAAMDSEYVEKRLCHSAASDGPRHP